MKETYRRLAEEYRLPWRGRRYDRSNPEEDDAVNQAINHAATAVYAAAGVAVAVAGTIPQLGFIHEDSGRAFALDIADLFRDSITLPAAFAAVKKSGGEADLERLVRQSAGGSIRREKVVPAMIDSIKELFDGDDGGRDA